MLAADDPNSSIIFFFTAKENTTVANGRSQDVGGTVGGFDAGSVTPIPDL
jgi:hypothetical protein